MRIAMPLKKHAEEIAGTVLGFMGGIYSQKDVVYSEWIQPIMVAGLCALVSLLISYFGKMLLNKMFKK